MENKSVIVIGGGPGGYVAAIRAAQLGAQVTVIEKDNLGGTCLNVGCIPTKCLIHNAEMLEEIKKRSSQIGLEISDVSHNFSQMMTWKNSVTRQLVNGIGSLFKVNDITKIDGMAKFKSPDTIAVTKPDGSEEIITADAVIIAAGSVNTVPPIPGIKESLNCIDSTGALSLEKAPESMVVIGGGVIGLEIACAYAAFGTKITVVEAMSSMLPMLDHEITKVGVNHLKKMGVKFNLSCKVMAVEDTDSGSRVICENQKGETVVFEGEKVLVAVGRRANTENLDLASAGIENDRGRIIVTDKMETNVPGVYAIGDCVFGHAMLAHTASDMGEVAAENIMGLDRHYDEATCPNCVYIMPEAASVGITETQAKEKGIAYKTGKFPMIANGKAIILNGGEGLVKIIADEESGKVLGMHIIGPRASDMICEGALAIKMEATITDLIETIHSHPSVTETMREAALNVEKRAINYIN